MQLLQEFNFPYYSVSTIPLSLSSRPFSEAKTMEKDRVSSLKNFNVANTRVSDVGVNT